MHAHAEIIETFYRAFQRRDAAAMGARYTPDATFEGRRLPARRVAYRGHVFRPASEHRTFPLPMTSAAACS